MKRTDIEQIIKGGSVRQKIKLYMTEIALFNTDVEELSRAVEQGESANSSILTGRQRDLIFNSIKTPADIKYYEDMRTYNGAFLTFKDRFSLELKSLLASYYYVSISINERAMLIENLEVINNLLDLYPEEKTREQAFKLALERTKEKGAVPAKSKHLEVDPMFYYKDIEATMERVITLCKSGKQFILMFKRILSKNLPVKPYKDWVKDQEKKLIQQINAFRDNICTEESYPKNFPLVPKYEDINVEITEEDLEDFKNAGL